MIADSDPGVYEDPLRALVKRRQRLTAPESEVVEPIPSVPDPYINPTVAARERRAAAPQTQMGLYALAGREQRGAEQYGRGRMRQLRRGYAQLPPELQQLIGQQNVGADPAAAWRNVSGAFSNYAKEQGFQDPRLLLKRFSGR